MATRLEEYTLAHDTTFLQRVEACLMNQVRTVLAASNETSGRRAAATRVMEDAPKYAAQLAKGIVSVTNISNTAPTGSGLSDATLDTVIAAAFDSLVR